MYHKTLFLMIVALAWLWAEEDQLIARDSNGVVVVVKEKYGGATVDTCTVVILHDGKFVLVHRNGTSAWYPTDFHSVKVVRKVVESGKAPANPDSRMLSSSENSRIAGIPGNW